MKNLIFVIALATLGCGDTPTSAPSWCSSDQADVLVGVWDAVQFRQGITHYRTLTVEKGASPCVYSFANNRVSEDSLHTYESRGELVIVEVNARADLLTLEIEARTSYFRVKDNHGTNMVGTNATIYEPYQARLWDDTLLLWGLHYYRRE